jgi:hypothetical protein
VVARLRELARALPDHKLAERLNAEGLRTRTGKAWTYARVHSMRKQHGIATACPLHTREADGARTGCCPWRPRPGASACRRPSSTSGCGKGVLVHDQRRSASRVWVRLDGATSPASTAQARSRRACRALGEVMRAEHLSRDELWDRVRRGEYQGVPGAAWPVLGMAPAALAHAGRWTWQRGDCSE